MTGAIQWLEVTFAGIPLPVLEVWGRLSYFLGLILAVLAFGGFSLRVGSRWGFGRERQAWDAKALAAMPLTFVLITISGYLGSSIVLVPGAQTFESLKDLVVFVCILLFGYPALITVPFAYGLADLIEGVPPDFLLGWLPGYFINPACFWLAYQLFGKNPDFTRAGTWGKYGVFVASFSLMEPVLWGYICSDRFTPEISYRQVTSALFFTTSLTWLIAPIAMLGALPLARSFGLFWAEIPGHVKERAFGRKEWAWEAGRAGAPSSEGTSPEGLPIRMFLLLPFIGLTLAMVAVTAYVTLRSAEHDAEKLALRLHQEVSDNIRLRLDDFLARQPRASSDDIRGLLAQLPISEQGRALVIRRSDRQVMGALENDAVVQSAVSNLRRELGDLADFHGVHEFSFDHVTAKPLSRETWLARAAGEAELGAARDYVVLTIMPEAFFLAGVRTGNSRSAIVFTAALLLSLLLAALMAARVTEPLRNISRATGALAAGDLATRVPESRLEELSALGQSFNTMAVALQGSFEKLESSQSRVQLAVKAANLGIWDWDIQSNELLWDDSMYELYGMAKADFGGAYEAWTKCLLPEDAPRAAADVEAALRGEREFQSEFRVRRADGEVRVITGMGKVLRNAQGRAQRMVGVNWDITERRKAEVERSELLHQLGERVKELKLLHAASHLLQRDRPFGEALLSELVLQMPQAWQYSECCEARIAYLGLDVKTPGFRVTAQHQSKTFATSDGSGVIEVVYTTPCPAAAEGPFLAEERAMLDSLAEMLARYLELRKHQENLEALVRDRTTALVQAKEQAESASRAKSTFLATMSHEIRTPMNAILGYGQLMQRQSDLSARDRERLDLLMSSGYHLLELINNVLEMSKIEAGHGEAVLVSFDLHKAINDVATMVRERFESKHLEFRVEGLETLPRTVRSDVAKLRQILINLLGNAAKFTERGAVSLRAESRSTPPGARLIFRVTDSGVGIAPDELLHIFEPFRQTRSGQRSQSGTGLGLSISRDFAKLLGGELSVASDLGAGATFTLELPVELDTGEDSKWPALSPRGRVIGLEAGAPVPNVLVVDDDRSSRRVLGELLASVGIVVFEAEDGARALECVARHRPQLVFMDVKMPEMNGIEVTRRIRELPFAESLPIVLVSASVLREDGASVLRTGANEFIAKPFREEDIWGTLERHLRLNLVRAPVAPEDKREPGLPSRAEVSALGANIVAELRRAIELGYVSRIPSILQGRGAEHEKTVAALCALANNLEIQRLTQLL